MASKNPKRAVDQIRAKIADLKQQRRDVGNAPVSRDEAEAAIDRYLDEVAATYRDGRVLHGLITRGVVENFEASERPEAFAAFMFPDVIKRQLMAEIDQHLENGLTRGERNSELSDIDRKLAAAEREEENTIREAENDGLDITRRSDADPRVVLDLDK